MAFSEVCAVQSVVLVTLCYVLPIGFFNGVGTNFEFRRGEARRADSGGWVIREYTDNRRCTLHSFLYLFQKTSLMKMFT